MLLSRMKKRMRFVKMLWFTILWHVILNLEKRGREEEEMVKETRSKRRRLVRECCSGQILVGVAEDEEGAGLRHGDHLLLQLNVGERSRPGAHWHLRLIIVIFP